MNGLHCVGASISYTVYQTLYMLVHRLNGIVIQFDLRIWLVNHKLRFAGNDMRIWHLLCSKEQPEIQLEIQLKRYSQQERE